MYAVEAALLERLPAVFNPELVFELDDETVGEVAAETLESVLEREELEKKRSTLQQALKTMQRLKIPKLPGTSACLHGLNYASAPLTRYITESAPQIKTPAASPRVRESSTSTVTIEPSTPEKRQAFGSYRSKPSPSQDSAIGLSDDERNGKNTSTHEDARRVETSRDDSRHGEDLSQSQESSRKFLTPSSRNFRRRIPTPEPKYADAPTLEDHTRPSDVSPVQGNSPHEQSRHNRNRTYG